MNLLLRIYQRTYLIVLQHGVAADVARVAEDGVALLGHPVEEVVVLAAPTVEAVGEPVDVLELLLGEGGHPAKVVAVDEPVLRLIGEFKERSTPIDGRLSRIPITG